MVMNSGQGPGGSPVPRVLMIAVFLIQSEKRKCRRRRERIVVVGGGGGKEN